MLPACEGDCLILSWGDDDQPSRLLIDAGRKSTASAIQAYADKHGRPAEMFELFIITHIDRDHIEGAVELLKDPGFRPLVKQVWFNDRADLDYAPPATEFEAFGALDGERLTTLIAENEMASNVDFKPGPVAVENEQLQTVILAGGLSLTVISPDQHQLSNLDKPWDDTLKGAPEGWEELGEPEPINIDFLASLPFKSDAAKPNGSSIAVIATYDGRSVLLTGDAHVGRLLRSLDIYKAQHPEFDGFALIKAAHHGSRGSVSLDLVKAVQCDCWAISTNGSQFKHPDREAIARIIVGSPQPVHLHFNYDTIFTGYWRSPTVQPYGFTTVYGDGYLAVDVPDIVESTPSGNV